MKNINISNQTADLNDTKVTNLSAAPDPAAAAVSGPLDGKVEAWFAKHFHGLGSMLDERLYNHIRAAVEDLKAELRKL